MRHQIDPSVQNDLLNYFIKNDITTHLSHRHLDLLERLAPDQQRACVEWTIKKKYKSIFPTGWLREQPKPANQHNKVDYCGTQQDCPAGMSIVEPHKKAKYAEMEQHLAEAISQWHDILENQGNDAAYQWSKQKRVELDALQAQYIADGAVMTTPETFEQWISNKNINS